MKRTRAARSAASAWRVTWTAVMFVWIASGGIGFTADRQGGQGGQGTRPEPKPLEAGLVGPWVWRYTPMREPKFAPAAQATLKPESRVMGVTINGVAKAYEDFVVHEHHFVQDTIAGVPVLLTWCGLCNSAMVYKNEVDGKPLTPDLAGLRGLNWVMRDRETGSLWQQATGEAFFGPLKGRRLAPLNFVLTTWAEWRKQQPQTLVLLQDPSHAEGYKQMAASHARGPLGGGQPSSWGKKLRDDPRLPEREQILGIETTQGHKAYPIAAVRERSLINDQVAGVPVVLVHSKESDMVTSFLRTHNGRALSFERATSGPNLVDRETGSLWTVYGESINGPLKGTKLEVVTPAPHFWFGWAQFHRDTEVFAPSTR